MLIAVLCLAFLLLFATAHLLIHNWRQAFLVATIISSISLTLLTEGLSLIRALTAQGILIGWLLIVAVAAAGLVILIRKSQPIARPRLDVLSRTDQALLSILVIIVIAIGIGALAAPPNSWDSMTYHMPRVMHWIQNGNLDHYPTHIIRQLYQNPWSEYVMLHFQLLAGTDAFANVAQWFSMVAGAVAASLIAARLKASITYQIGAALLSVTVPMGILQATSSLNDYVLAYWVIVFAYCLIVLNQDGFSWRMVLAASASLSLAVLTKGTSYVILSSFVMWFAAWAVFKLRWSSWKPLVVMSSIVVLVNAGHFLRNYQAFGSPLGWPPESASYINQSFSVTGLASNTIRNVSSHAATPFASINERIASAVVTLHNILGIDPNDPRYTYDAHLSEFQFQISNLNNHEIFAGNLIPSFIILVGCIIFLVNGRLRSNRLLGVYGLVTLLSAAAFCLVVRWQAQNTRLELPYFILWSPFVAVVLGSIRRKFVPRLLIGLAVVGAVPFILMNASRPMIPMPAWQTYSTPWIFAPFDRAAGDRTSVLFTSREQEYFADRTERQAAYATVVEKLIELDCHNIAMTMDDDAWEYPLWTLSQARSFSARFIHVNVTNNPSASISQSEPFRSFFPCAVVQIRDTYTPDIASETAIKVGEVSFTPIWEQDVITLFTPGR